MWTANLNAIPDIIATMVGLYLEDSIPPNIKEGMDNFKNNYVVFKIKNTTGGPIILSWVLPAHINTLPFVDPSHLRQMSIIREKFTKKDLSCQIGHTFICTNKYGIIRIFKSKCKNEIITI